MKIKWDHMTQIEQDAYMQGYDEGKKDIIIVFSMAIFVGLFFLFILYVILP